MSKENETGGTSWYFGKSTAAGSEPVWPTTPTTSASIQFSCELPLTAQTGPYIVLTRFSLINHLTAPPPSLNLNLNLILNPIHNQLVIAMPRHHHPTLNPTYVRRCPIFIRPLLSLLKTLSLRPTPPVTRSSDNTTNLNGTTPIKKSALGSSFVVAGGGGVGSGSPSTAMEVDEIDADADADAEAEAEVESEAEAEILGAVAATSRDHPYPDASETSASAVPSLS
jgi:hypothetical protein